MMKSSAGEWKGGFWVPKEEEELEVLEVKKMGRKKGGKNGVKKEVKKLVAADDLVMVVTKYKECKKEMYLWKDKMMKLIEAE